MASDFLPIKYAPLGRMTSDLDPMYRVSGNYGIGTKNIQHTSQLGNTAPSVEIKLGNEFAYTLGSISAQNAVFRVYLDAINNTDTYTLSMFNGNGVSVGIATWTGILNNPVAMGNTAIANIVAAANPLGIAWTPVVQTSATEGYFDFQFFGGTSVDYWDYNLSLSSTNTNPTLPIIVQEARDVSLAGDLVHIGKYDLGGDLFIWSTTQHELPSEIAIQGISASPNVPLIRITIANHGLVSGEKVVIKGALTNPTGVHEANGSWIISVIDANNFDLLGSSYSTSWLVGTGFVTINPQGIGQIGVAQRDDNNNTWTYIALLTSKEFNFVTKRQPRTYCERNDILASLYWTDNYNVPRAMYYAGAYITNGALAFVNPLGEYSYGSIAVETLLIRNNNSSHLLFDSQLQSGGNLLAGNHRYVYRFLTENITPTLWSDPSNDINVFNSTLPIPAENIFGDNAGDRTPKINQLTIVGITPGLYKYVEIGDLYYTSTAPPSGSIIGRFLLTQQINQTFQHTGFETDTQVLDVASLLGIQADIVRALNIDSVNNRLVLSNTSSATEIDFSEISQTFTHKLIRTTVDGILSRFNGTIREGEFQKPENVFYLCGYMLNETYRYGVKYKLKSGFITDTFWVDDVIFNIDPINTANPFGDNRRVVGGQLPDFNLTDSTANDVYTYGIEFQNINWDYIIGGTVLRSLVDEIIFERVEMSETTNEVIASGVIVLGCSSSGGLYGSSAVFATRNGTTYPFNYNFGTSNQISGGAILFGICDYFFASGRHWLVNGGANGIFVLGTGTVYPDNPTYPRVPVITDFDAQPSYMSFYSPDLMFGNSQYDWQSTDQLLNFGAPIDVFQTFVGTPPPGQELIGNDLREFSGNFIAPNTNPDVYSIDASVNITKTGSNTINGITYYKSTAMWISVPLPPPDYDVNLYQSFPTSPVLHTTNPVSFTGVGADYGLYNSQIFRRKLNKFGDINKSKYIPCGASVSYTGTALGTATVYGGDTMTQKTWIKHRIPSVGINLVAGNNNDLYPFSSQGFGGGVAIYSQNRVNSEMINREDSITDWKYPIASVSESSWLEFLSPSSDSGIIYNFGYNIVNGVSSDSTYDPNLKRSNRQPARIWWSDVKPENSIVDNYTNFLPLNFKDLQLNFGEISQHMNVNGQLMSWQEGHFELQYFDSTGLLVTNAQEAVLGNAGVMPQRGSALSTYGTGQGFSVIKGKTAGGKDMTAWIDFVHGKVVRFDPSQGTTVISDVHQMRSFFNNNLRFAKLHDTPADGEGTHGEWDDQTSEFIWTVRAWKNLDEWTAGTYTAGSEVYYGTTDFHEVPAIYVANVNTSNAPNTADWTQISIDNNGYYNVYTVAFDKDGFTTFHSFLPKIYLKRGKSLLSPRPVGDERRAYEHYRGQYCVWYTDGQSELVRDAEIDGMSINYDPDQNKHFLAVEMNTEIVPKKMRFFTKQNESYLDDTDFEKRIDVWVSKIKNDSSVTINNPTGRNDLDTSFIFGTYVSADLIMEARKYQKLFNFIMKAKISGRSWRS